MTEEDEMRKPSKLTRTWLLAALIGIAGAAIQMSPAEAARMGGFRGGGGHWHGGGNWHGGGHWRGNWHGHRGCWNCGGGWGWGAAGFATGLALGAGWPYYGYGYGYGYGYPYGGYAYGYPYYSTASYGGCRLVRRAYHTSHGTVVRRVRVCY